SLRPVCAPALTGGGCVAAPGPPYPRKMLACGSTFSGTSPVVKVKDWDAVTFGNNTVVGGAANADQPLEDQRLLALGHDKTSHRHDGYTWDHNAYYDVQDASVCANAAYKPFDDGMPTDGFGLNAPKTYSSPVPNAPSWVHDTGLDMVGSSYACNSVPRNYAVVRANKYEKRRAHIVVYNWKYWTKRTTKVSVSLANAGLKPGDKVTI